MQLPNPRLRPNSLPLVVALLLLGTAISFGQGEPPASATACSANTGFGFPYWNAVCEGKLGGTTNKRNCLFVPELIVRGSVKDNTGKMVAVVSNARSHDANEHLQFLHEQDQLFNGTVEKIGSNSVTFCVHAGDNNGDKSGHQVTVAIAAPSSTVVSNDTPSPSTDGPSASGTAVKSFRGCTSGRYTGERFDFHLADMNIVDFFRLIHQETGLNIMLNSSVKGAVSIEAAGIPWDEVLVMAMRKNGLECELHDNMLRVASLEILRDEAEHKTLGVSKQGGCIPGEGLPINADLVDVQLKDLFNVIGELSHLKVLLDPSVTGAVTLDLTDSLSTSVLDLVVRDKGLQCKLEGDTIHIAASPEVNQVFSK